MGVGDLLEGASAAAVSGEQVVELWVGRAAERAPQPQLGECADSEQVLAALNAEPLCVRHDVVVDIAGQQVRHDVGEVGRLDLAGPA